MRVTAAAPAATSHAANQMAMCLGQSEGDGQTFSAFNWIDASGNLYAAASFEAGDEWLASAQATLQRPAWDTGGVIDMDAANHAQAAMVFWQATEDSPTPPAADPLHLTAIGGYEGPSALAMMGLTPAPEVTDG